jgi:hypothetical protein
MVYNVSSKSQTRQENSGNIIELNKLKNINVFNTCINKTNADLVETEWTSFKSCQNKFSSFTLINKENVVTGV